MMTIAELARLAGVSDATVSLVLAGKDHGRVSATRRRQVLDLARQHGYRANPAARALAQGRSNRIGLCLAGTITSHAIIGEFSLHERLGLFAEAIQKAGYALEIIQADPGQPPKELARDLHQRPVDGFVFLNWPAEVLEEPLLYLLEQSVPAVASGSAFATPGLTWTDADSHSLFSQLLSLLQHESRLHLAFVDTVITAMEPEFEACLKEALARWANLSPVPCDVIRPPQPGYEGVFEGTCTLLRTQPELDALFLLDNFLAQAVLNAVFACGRRPGEDLRVIGYGDTVFADQCHPRLSHYSRRIEEQVRLGLEALLDQIENPTTCQPQQINLEPEFVQRQT